MEIPILLYGKENTGKSTYLKRLCDGEYQKTYIPTTSIKETKYEISTNIGNISVKFIEVPYGYDISKLSFSGIIFFYNDENDTKYNTPYNKVNVISKIDNKDKKNNNDFIYISSKSWYHIDMPLLYIIHKIYNNNICFIEHESIIPNSVKTGIISLY